VRRLCLILALGLLATACRAGSTEPVTAVQRPVATTTTIPVTTTTEPPTTTTTLPPTPTTVPEQPSADPPPPPPDRSIPAAMMGALVIAEGGADLFFDRTADPYVRAHEGLVFPVIERDDEWLQVLDQCNDPGWVLFDEVAFSAARRDDSRVGAGMEFSDAVVVVDPGHGGPNVGAVGPAGLVEKVVNLDIARRLRDLLRRPHTVDWESGEIFNGSAIPAAGQVWMTRQEGPEGADIETGLTFRTTLSDSLNAHALVSIHNNAAPDGPFEGPGSEVYYKVADLESKRLSGLVVEELRQEFSAFEAAWVGADDAGAKVRVGTDGVDLYGILRQSDAPSVIVEGVYISNESEEALLGTAEFRQAYADAVYRALVRFVTTDEDGSGFVDTEPFTGGLSSGRPAGTCSVPAQPEATP